MGASLPSPVSVSVGRSGCGRDAPLFVSMSIDEAGAGKGRYVIDGWSRFGDDVPAPVVIARYADVANFASNGASRDRARDAWEQVGALRAQVGKRAGFFVRIRRALSLRSLRMRRKLRLSASIARTMHEEEDR